MNHNKILVPPGLTWATHSIGEEIDSAHFDRALAMGLAVRTRGHSYGSRLWIDLWCVAEAQTFRDAILTFIYPASAILFDFVVNGELLSPAQFVGLVIVVLSGVGITQGWELTRIAIPWGPQS